MDFRVKAENVFIKLANLEEPPSLEEAQAMADTIAIVSKISRVYINRQIKLAIPLLKTKAMAIKNELSPEQKEKFKAVLKALINHSNKTASLPVSVREGSGSAREESSGYQNMFSFQNEYKRHWVIFGFDEPRERKGIVVLRFPEFNPEEFSDGLIDILVHGGSLKGYVQSKLDRFKLSNEMLGDAIFLSDREMGKVLPEEAEALDWEQQEAQKELDELLAEKARMDAEEEEEREREADQAARETVGDAKEQSAREQAERDNAELKREQKQKRKSRS